MEDLDHRSRRCFSARRLRGYTLICEEPSNLIERSEVRLLHVGLLHDPAYNDARVLAIRGTEEVDDERERLAAVVAARRRRRERAAI